MPLKATIAALLALSLAACDGTRPVCFVDKPDARKTGCAAQPVTPPGLTPGGL